MDEDILHQADVETVIENVIDRELVAAPAIADLDPASAAYVEAEANEVRDAINDILATLRTNGLVTPTGP